MSPTLARPRESGQWKRAVVWLLLLAPLFFLSYGLANDLTARRDDVGSLVFDWEQGMPLWPWTILPYWSIDLLYGLSFLCCASRAEVDRHALRLLSAQVLCIAGFLLWPLRFTFQRPELDGLFGWMFDVLMGFDKPFNQAPSLHITLLVVLWVMFARHLTGAWRLLVHGWFALIGVSVLTTWQHHFIDVPTGALAGWLCVWLWPDEGPSPLRSLRLARTTQRWKLASFYALGSGLGVILAGALGGAGLWLLWPALALAMVALNYALFGAAGFQKSADGSLSPAVRWLLAPYLAGAWLNARLWTRQHPQPREVADGVWLGRLPAAAALRDSPFRAVVDLCAEIPCAPQGRTYLNLPVLDLTAPDSATCRAAARFIEQARGQGPVLVCCALGYSRSATAVAAWLLHSGRAPDVDAALAQLRAASPQVRLGMAQRQALEALGTTASTSPLAGAHV
ncbi:MAG: phosphatase PAP2/dual specificity phosphatase family protein [Pseudomonas sp.]|uniref:phosphatase PAP2/dual specificity phosphatase family protein n=1 Tax=Pseudomonas sp. TaxID=306 RepID=UPI0033991C80